jgi:hypothetical protein
METNTYRFGSTWIWLHIDPILCNNFSCRSKSTEKPILAVTDLWILISTLQTLLALPGGNEVEGIFCVTCNLNFRVGWGYTE